MLGESSIFYTSKKQNCFSSICDQATQFLMRKDQSICKFDIYPQLKGWIQEKVNGEFGCF